MLGAAVERVRPLVLPENVFVITGRALKPAIEDEVREIPPENVIAEPEGKNTAACLALASAFLEQKYRDDDDVIMIVLTADHFIRDAARFETDCAAAIAYAEENDALVTFGIPPARTETGYGYLEVGEPTATPGITRVGSFREKPDLPTAKAFLENGSFLWNAGMFVWRNSSINKAFRKYLPEMHAQIAGMRDAFAGSDTERQLAACFNQVQKISIDFGVLEKADNVFVVRAGFDWDDIGTWSSLKRLLENDAHGNVVFGKAVPVKCQDSVIYSVPDEDGSDSTPIVIGFDLKDIVVVRTPDAILVLPAKAAQEVKDVVSYLRGQGLTKYL